MNIRYKFSENLLRFIELANLDIDDPDTYERDGSRSFVNHVLLYGKNAEAIENVLDALSGYRERNVDADAAMKTTATNEVARVDLRRKRTGVGTMEVHFCRQARALVIDVGLNRRSSCAIPAFLAQVASAADVTSQQRNGLHRRMVVMKNAHMLTPSCQSALRAVIEKAAATTWFVFTSADVSSLDAALLSRFVCLNATPNEKREQRQPGYNDDNNDDAFAARLFAKIARLKTTGQLKSVASIPKTEIPKKTSSSSSGGNDYDVMLGPLFARLIKRMAAYHLRQQHQDENAYANDFDAPARAVAGAKAAAVAHVHPQDLYAIVSRFAELERQHAETKRLLLAAGESSAEEEATIPALRMSDHTHTFIACACMETRARLCYDERCCSLSCEQS